MVAPDPLAARLAELEARFTLQQDTLDKLSEELWRQQRELEALRARVATVEARAAAPSEAGDAPEPDEPPPHY
jgi:SlyX protein